MDRKTTVVIVVLVVGVAGFLLVRDPVGAADTVRNFWDVLVGLISKVASSLTTFLKQLFHA